MAVSRRGRAHDAEGTRTAILDAAEEVFAEHGFDGARIDAIAAAAAYNKSLIFQYFGDKLNLYAEVLKRADREMNELQAYVLMPFVEDETISSSAQKLRMVLEVVIRTIFNYLVEHPRIMRIFIWEMAEGYQTYAKISSQLHKEDVKLLEKIVRKAHQAGLLRSSYNPLMQIVMAIYFCPFCLGSIPLYQMVRPDKDFSSSTSLACMQEYIVGFIVHGIMVDPPTCCP